MSRSLQPKRTLSLFFVLNRKGESLNGTCPAKSMMTLFGNTFFSSKVSISAGYERQNVPLYIPTERSHIQSRPMTLLRLTALWNTCPGRKPATTGVYTWIIWSDSFHDVSHPTSGSIHGTLHHNRPHMLSVMVCHLSLCSHKSFAISPGFCLFYVRRAIQTGEVPSKPFTWPL